MPRSNTMRKYSQELRDGLVERWLHGEKVPALSRELGVHETTAYGWVSKMQRTIKDNPEKFSDVVVTVPKFNKKKPSKSIAKTLEAQIERLQQQLAASAETQVHLEQEVERLANRCKSLETVTVVLGDQIHGV